MKQTEESLKIKRNIQDAENRKYQIKIEKARLQMIREELERMSGLTKMANNWIFRMHP